MNTVSNDTPLRRILVRGCPRSGNTMLYFMMLSCFEDVRQIRGEQIPFSKFIKAPTGVYIAKYPRPVNKPILGDDYDEAVSFMTSPPEDSFCIFIIRDPRDALRSEHGAFSGEPFLKDAKAWMGVAAEIERLSSMNNVIVLRFEDVVLSSDAQQEKISEATGLKISAPFSEFDRAIASGSIIMTEHNEKELKGLRPVDPARVFAWKSISEEELADVETKLRGYPGIDGLLERFGYEPLRTM